MKRSRWAMIVASGTTRMPPLEINSSFHYSHQLRVKIARTLLCNCFSVVVPACLRCSRRIAAGQANIRARDEVGASLANRRSRDHPRSRRLRNPASSDGVSATTKTRRSRGPFWTPIGVPFQRRLTNIALHYALILPPSANPSGRNFRQCNCTFLINMNLCSSEHEARRLFFGACCALNLIREKTMGAPWVHV
jgi:hypothetical protein